MGVMAKMGKGARNERRKIGAAFLNGLALIVVGTGYFGTLLKIFEKLDPNSSFLDALASISIQQWTALAVAFVGALILHGIGVSLLADYED